MLLSVLFAPCVLAADRTCKEDSLGDAWIDTDSTCMLQLRSGSTFGPDGGPGGEPFGGPGGGPDGLPDGGPGEDPFEDPFGGPGGGPFLGNGGAGQDMGEGKCSVWGYSRFEEIRCESDSSGKFDIGEYKPPSYLYKTGKWLRIETENGPMSLGQAIKFEEQSYDLTECQRACNAFENCFGYTVIEHHPEMNGRWSVCIFEGGEHEDDIFKYCAQTDDDAKGKVISETWGDLQGMPFSKYQMGKVRPPRQVRTAFYHKVPSFLFEHEPAEAKDDPPAGLNVGDAIPCLQTTAQFQTLEEGKGKLVASAQKEKAKKGTKGKKKGERRGKIDKKCLKIEKKKCRGFKDKKLKKKCKKEAKGNCKVGTL